MQTKAKDFHINTVVANMHLVSIIIWNFVSWPICKPHDSEWPHSFLTLSWVKCSLVTEGLQLPWIFKSLKDWKWSLCNPTPSEYKAYHFIQQFLLTVHKLMIELEVVLLPLFSHGTPRLGLDTPNSIHFTTAYSLQGWIFYCCKGTPFKACPLFPALLQTTEVATGKDTALTVWL